MNYHPSSAIVGFRLPQTEATAADILSRAPGFVRIVRFYRFANAFLAQVDPSLLDKFIDSVLQQDEVEYVDRNYLVQFASYDEHVHPLHTASQWSSQRARLLHNLQDNSLIAGIGVKIALIDSGLSPHPYLPSLSSIEMANLRSKWRLGGVQNNRQALREIDNLKGVETPSGSSPLERQANPQVQKQYINDSKQLINRLEQALLLEWIIAAEDWRKTILQIPRTPTPITSKPAQSPSPPIPVRRYLPGVFRRISFDSYNFVMSDLNIEDSYGHGTAMAGILVGQPPDPVVMCSSPGGGQLATSYMDVLGIVPCAELVICKVYDTKNLAESNLDAVIRALEHAADIDVDIIYVGAVFDPDAIPPQVKKLISLNRTISAIVKKYETLIVCPSGNSSKAGLWFPAAAEGAIAVSAVTCGLSSPPNIVLADYSTIADVAQKEELSFCAFGGKRDEGVLTTYRYFGFTTEYGTSVAAAIAAGILAADLSRHCVEKTDDEYEKAMAKAVRDGDPFSGISWSQIFARPIRRLKVLEEAKDRCERSCFGRVSFPSERYGWGVIKPR